MQAVLKSGRYQLVPLQHWVITQSGQIESRKIQYFVEQIATTFENHVSNEDKLAVPFKTPHEGNLHTFLVEVSEITMRLAKCSRDLLERKAQRQANNLCERDIESVLVLLHKDLPEFFTDMKKKLIVPRELEEKSKCQYCSKDREPNSQVEKMSWVFGC